MALDGNPSGSVEYLQNKILEGFKAQEELRVQTIIFAHLIKSLGGEATFTREELDVMDKNPTITVFKDSFGNHHIKVESGD